MMERSDASEEGVVVSASVARHLALAPVAFAVTEGPAHEVIYANTLFQNLQLAKEICIGEDAHTPRSPSETDLNPLLSDVRRDSRTVRDVMLEPNDGETPRWSCSVWPVAELGAPPTRLVIEVRDVALIEGAKERQRAIAERLLLSALGAEDAARDATRASDRAQYLAAASRDLSLSLDERTTRETVRSLTLPRPGVWCIVDVVESNGALHRLAVIHPDPAKHALAQLLEEQWPSTPREAMDIPLAPPAEQPTIVAHGSDAALGIAAHGEANLQILRQIGFGSLLIVPLIVRARVQGSITFVSREGDAPFSVAETALAVELAARCAMALDNARLYREADALRLAAEAANQSKSEFLGSMSHELRTPLNAIGGFAELIEMGIEGPVTERQRVGLARIKANQQHLLMLITEILNFVRIESGRMEYRIAPISLTQALADVASMLSGVIEGKGLILESVPCDADVVALGDRDRVHQVLVNLIMNAVKYTPRGGGTITLRCSIDGDGAIAQVVDTGPGISETHLQSIFEPFVQLSAGIADRGGGVGLGLPISRDLARAMKGDLTVESTLGVGSRFSLRLPRVP